MKLAFQDLLYGRIELPGWLDEFIRLPEFVRLRGVRLSNVDSIEFKDLSGPTRWEHGIATAYLASITAARRNLSPKQGTELILASLLHDVATPPFAHTAEYVLTDFDHELETQRLLSASRRGDSSPELPVFAASLPAFQRACERLRRKSRITVDPDEVARMVTGDGELGFLVSGTLDLDNADNVVRGCAHLGIEVDKHVPLRIAEWLSTRDGPPLELDQIEEPAVQAWVSYRSEYYSRFFDAGDAELGRQAYLQHLMRRALDAGLPRRVLIWNTEEGLLESISRLHEEFTPARRWPLRELLSRYRLLDSPGKVSQIELDRDHLRLLRNPQATAWLEGALTTEQFEPFVMIVSRRFARAKAQQSLFPPAEGALLIFSLDARLRPERLPSWLSGSLPSAASADKLRTHVTKMLTESLPQWARERPWLADNVKRNEDVRSHLDSVGDWSFRLSRNESLHAYPSTFVHAIPATLIRALGVQGELVLDPFGGTGQTATEVVKGGGLAISADSNTVATLAAKARLSYLSKATRQQLLQLEADAIRDIEPGEVPEFDGRQRWHHRQTALELSQILRLIRQTRNSLAQQFLLATFSAVLPSTTARKGKQHGFFADNTPLSAGTVSPPYENAISLFLARVKRNVRLVEKFYAAIERDGRSPKEELLRARVLSVDASKAKPEDYGVNSHSVAAIISSPPYLCMSDYTLGQRLSYYWLFPDSLNCDFEREIGARRRRSDPKRAARDYFNSLTSFASSVVGLLRPGGFLALVLGEPVATSFQGIEVVATIDDIFREVGICRLWDTSRPIYWHRNQGYQRLRTESVRVYVAPG